MITPEPLQLTVLCKHCGTYLQAEWEKYNTGVEIAVDTLPHCCSEDKDEVRVTGDRVKALAGIKPMLEEILIILNNECINIDKDRRMCGAGNDNKLPRVPEPELCGVDINNKGGD